MNTGEKKVDVESDKIIDYGKSTTTTMTITDSTKSPVVLSSSIEVADASKRTKKVKITGNSLANTIKGGSGNDTIYGKAGNDDILGNNGADVLYGGEGDDTINGGAGNDKIYGDAGNDVLHGGAGKDTLNGGAGNDKIYGDAGNDWFIVKVNEGNDTIADYESGKDVIQLATKNSKVTGWSSSGNDVVLTINGKNKLTVKNGLGKEITFADSSGKKSKKTYKTENYTAVDVMKSFMQVLDRTNTKSESGISATLDKAIKTASRGKFKTLDALITSFMKDFRANVGTYYADPKTKDFLWKYCGILMDNADTGAISGSDAGGEKVKTAESIMPETSLPSSWKLPTSRTTSINGLTVEWYAKNQDSAYGNFPYFSSQSAYNASLSSSEKTIVKGLNSQWIKLSLDLIASSYGLTFKEKKSASESVGTTTASIEDVFEDDSSGDWLAYVSYLPDSKGISHDLTLSVNNYYYNNVVPGDPNGATTESDVGLLDRTLAHELTHASMAANMNYFSYLPAYIKEGAAELVHGVDDEREYEIYGLMQQSSANELEKLFRDKSNRANGTDKFPNADYAGGYMLLRYLAKQSATAPASTNRSVSYGSQIKLNNLEGEVLGVALASNQKDAVLTTKTGKITVKNGANHVLDIRNMDGTKASYYAEKGVTGSGANSDGLVVSNKSVVVSSKYDGETSSTSSSIIDLYDYPGATRLNASGSKKDNLVLWGSYDTNDLLIAGNGSKNFLDGNFGNDTLCGGKGEDIFTWSCWSDNDTIVNYTPKQDYIKYDGEGSLDGYTVSGKDVILYNSLSDATLTVKNVTVDDITVIDSDGNESSTWKRSVSRSSVEGKKYIDPPENLEVLRDQALAKIDEMIRREHEHDVAASAISDREKTYGLGTSSGLVSYSGVENGSQALSLGDEENIKW